MKKFLLRGVMIGVGFVCVVGISLFIVNAAWNETKSAASNTTSPSANQKLTASEWNNMVEHTVPPGAIMVFDLTACPDGWTRYTKADGRFVMGASSGFGSIGGSNDVKLNIENVPEHSHYYKDTVFSKSHSYSNASDLHKSVNGYRWLDVSRKDFYYKDFYYGVTFSNQMVGSADTDKDNNPIYGVRGTSTDVCDFGYRERTTVYGNRGDVDINGGFFNMSSLKTEIDKDCVDDQKSVDIQNPYVKLLICKKD